MQALNTYKDRLQHHAQHLGSPSTLALAAIIGKATMPAAQGPSGRWDQLASLPLCISTRGHQYCCRITLPAREASNVACGPMFAWSEHLERQCHFAGWGGAPCVMWPHAPSI